MAAYKAPRVPATIDSRFRDLPTPSDPPAPTSGRYHESVVTSTLISPGPSGQILRSDNAAQHQQLVDSSVQFRPAVSSQLPTQVFAYPLAPTTQSLNNLPSTSHRQLLPSPLCHEYPGQSTSTVLGTSGGVPGYPSGPFVFTQTGAGTPYDHQLVRDRRRRHAPSSLIPDASPKDGRIIVPETRPISRKTRQNDHHRHSGRNWELRRSSSPRRVVNSSEGLGAHRPSVPCAPISQLKVRSSSPVHRQIPFSHPKNSSERPENRATARTDGRQGSRDTRNAISGQPSRRSEDAPKVFRSEESFINPSESTLNALLRPAAGPKQHVSSLDKNIKQVTFGASHVLPPSAPVNLAPQPEHSERSHQLSSRSTGSHVSTTPALFQATPSRSGDSQPSNHYAQSLSLQDQITKRHPQKHSPQEGQLLSPVPAAYSARSAPHLPSNQSTLAPDPLIPSGGVELKRNTLGPTKNNQALLSSSAVEASDEHSSGDLEETSPISQPSRSFVEMSYKPISDPPWHIRNWPSLQIEDFVPSPKHDSNDSFPHFGVGQQRRDFYPPNLSWLSDGPKISRQTNQRENEDSKGRMPPLRQRSTRLRETFHAGRHRARSKPNRTRFNKVGQESFEETTRQFDSDDDGRLVRCSESFDMTSQRRFKQGILNPLRRTIKPIGPTPESVPFEFQRDRLKQKTHHHHADHVEHQSLDRSVIKAQSMAASPVSDGKRPITKAEYEGRRQVGRVGDKVMSRGEPHPASGTEGLDLAGRKILSVKVTRRVDPRRVADPSKKVIPPKVKHLQYV